MTQEMFLVRSRNFFPRRDWPWIIKALHQDPLVFDSLLETQICSFAFSNLPASAEFWTPASLALLQLSDPPQVKELMISPIKSVEKSLRNEAASAYAGWIKDPKPVVTLRDAGLLALSLRERLRIVGSWSGIKSELDGRENYLKSVIACLFGMIPQPMDLLRAFLENGPEGSHLEICLHSLLSFPAPIEVQLDLIEELFKGSNPIVILAGLKILSRHRPELVRDSADKLFEYKKFEKIDEIVGKSYSRNAFWMKNFEKVHQLDRLAQLLFVQEYEELASIKQASLPLITESVDITNRIQAGLKAKLVDLEVTDSKDQPNRERDLRLWKQVTQLAPDNPVYSAGLAKALLRSGRAEDARAYLEAREVESSNELHPIIPITSARIAVHSGDIENAEKEAQRAIDILGNGKSKSLDIEDYLFLSDFFSDLNEFEKAKKAAQIGVLNHQNNAALYNQLAAVQIAEGNFLPAAENACLALALDENPEYVKQQRLNRKDSHELLIKALEREGDWQSALDERIDRIEKNGEENVLIYQELAICAIQARQIPLAMTVCNEALNIEPSNGISFTLLAKAYFEAQDFSMALSTYKQALQVMPNYEVPWIDLAQIYRMNGDEEKFFETLNAAIHAVPESPEIHLSLAEAYLERNALTQAVEKLRIAQALSTSFDHPASANEVEKLKLKPIGFENDLDLNARIAYRLGQALYRLGYREEANTILESAYQQSIYLQSSRKKSSQLGDLDVELAHLYSKTLTAAGNHANAIEVLRLVVNDRPEDPAAALDLARELLVVDTETGRNAGEAIEVLNRAYDLGSISNRQIEWRNDPDHPEQALEAMTLYAEALVATGDIQEAKNVFRFALENTSLNDSVLRIRLCIGLSRVAIRLGEPQMALASLTEAASIDPENLEINKGLTEAYRETGLFEDSFSFAKKVFEFGPENSELLEWYADQLYKLDELSLTDKEVFKEEAINAYKILLQINPDNFEILLRLTRIFMRNNEKSEAIEYATNLSDNQDLISTANALEVFELGLILNELGQSERAICTIENAVNRVQNLEIHGINDKTPKASEMYAWLSDIRYQRGELGEAVSDIDEALRLQPDQPDFFIKKTNLLMQLQDFQNAKDCIISGLSQFTNDDRLYKCAARLHFRGEEISKAIQYAEIAISVENENSESAVSDPASLLAAEISRSALQPLRAMDYLGDDSIITSSKENEIKRNFLLAELALDNNDHQKAQVVYDSLQKIAPDHPRVTAIGSRIMADNVSEEVYRHRLRETIEELKKVELVEEGVKCESSLQDIYSDHRSVAEACLELGLWDDAVVLLNEVTKYTPFEPLSNLLFAKAIIMRAEAQAICSLMDVTHHMPGNDAMNEEWFSSFNQAISRATKQISELAKHQDDVSRRYESDLTLETIKLWQARGQVVFKTETDYLEDYLEILMNSDPLPTDVAACLLGINRLGDQNQRVEEIRTRILSLLDKLEFQDDPLILNQLSILQMNRLSVQAYERAIRSARNLMNNPSNFLSIPMADYLIAKTAIPLGEIQSAKEAIERAIQAKPDEFEWNKFAATFYSLKDEKNHLPDFDKSIEYLQKIIDLDPDNTSHYLELGEVCKQAGNLSLAVTVLSRASQVNPQSYEILIKLARAQLAVGDLNGAENSSLKALQLAGDPVLSFLVMAEIELDKGDQGKAFEYIQQILESHPDHPAALFLLSKILVKEDQLKEAVEVLDKAIAVGEDVLPLQIERLKILKILNGADQIMLEVNYLLQLYPDHPKILVLLMETLDELGKQEEALQVAKRALQFDEGVLAESEKIELHYILGVYAFREGQLDQAVLHLRYVTENDPTHVEGLLELGKVFQERRQNNEALEIFKKGIQTAPQDFRCYYYAGLLLKENKEYDRAEHMLRQASKLEPGDTQIHRMVSAVAALNIIHNRRQITEEMPTS